MTFDQAILVASEAAPDLLQRVWAEMYEGHLESKERFAIQRYLLITGKKKNMQVFLTHVHLLLHIVTLDIEALVVP